MWTAVFAKNCNISETGNDRLLWSPRKLGCPWTVIVHCCFTIYASFGAQHGNWMQMWSIKCPSQFKRFARACEIINMRKLCAAALSRWKANSPESCVTAWRIAASNYCDRSREPQQTRTRGNVLPSSMVALLPYDRSQHFCTDDPKQFYVTMRFCEAWHQKLTGVLIYELRKIIGYKIKLYWQLLLKPKVGLNNAPIMRSVNGLSYRNEWMNEW